MDPEKDTKPEAAAVNPDFADLPKAPGQAQPEAPAQSAASDTASTSVAPPPVQAAESNGISLAGFIVSLVGLVSNIFTLGIASVVGLVLSIVGFVKAKRTGQGKGLALGGIIISSISIVFTIVIGILFASMIAAIFMGYNTECDKRGPGTHVLENGTQLTCSDEGGFQGFEQDQDVEFRSQSL